MLLSLNPPDAGIKKIIAASKHAAAKWIEDSATGEKWFWPAEFATHASVAAQLSIVEYSKGIAITEQ